MSDRRLSRRHALGLTAGLGLAATVSPSLAFGAAPAPSAYPKGQRPQLLNVFDESSRIVTVFDVPNGASFTDVTFTVIVFGD